MEDKLKNLIGLAQPGQKWLRAQQWSAAGKKVIGTDSSAVPEEIIHAAGMLPLRLIGTEREGPLALAYFPANFDQYCRQVLESALSGELSFVHGVVVTDLSDETRRLGDMLRHLKKFPLIHRLHIPYSNGSLNEGQFHRQLEGLRSKLAELSGAAVDDRALSRSIALFNRMRHLVLRVYQLRQRDTPPLTGAEMLGLTVAAQVMPKEEYVSQLEGLLPYLEQRQVSPEPRRPRLLVCSDKLFHPLYLQLIEDSGAIVVMDDMDTGSHYFWVPVADSSDPLLSLAHRYLNRLPEPRMANYDKQIGQVLQWVKEYHADGVINFPQLYDYNRLCLAPHFEERLKQAGVPVLTLTRDYFPANLAQLRTRVEAFVETLGE